MFGYISARAETKTYSDDFSTKGHEQEKSKNCEVFFFQCHSNEAMGINNGSTIIFKLYLIICSVSISLH